MSRHFQVLKVVQVGCYVACSRVESENKKEIEDGPRTDSNPQRYRCRKFNKEKLWASEMLSLSKSRNQ